MKLTELIQTKDPEIILLVGHFLNKNVARQVAIKHKFELSAFHYNFVGFVKQ